MTICEFHFKILESYNNFAENIYMLRTLIVDDEVHSSELLHMMIGKHVPQLNVIGKAGNVLEAYEFLLHNEIDLLFLDVGLKGQSGFDLLDKLTNRKFHFITLSASTEFALKTFEYGGSGYLLKPVNKEELQKAIYYISECFAR
jgi:two-component system LytT family response regulator